MYRLLIVDDLPIITEGLADLFEKEQRLQLEVHKAYSGFEALELLKKHRIDIVLTDILMPGMDGIELLRQIRKSWPICKVILLTSHNDFNYVQSAMSLGGLEYILKTENDDVIIQAVEKAIGNLDKEHDARRLIEKAEAHMRLALPTLQKEYIWSMLQGKKVRLELLAEHFANLQLSFRAERPVLLMICRVDDWNEVTTAPDKALIIYAVQNIVDEFLSASTHPISIVYESSRMVWIIQPHEQEAGEWDSTFHYVNGMMELIQGKCQELLKLSISCVLGSHAVEWPELADRFHALKYLLVRGIGGRSGTLLTDGVPPLVGKDDSQRTSPAQASARSYELQSMMPMLLSSLENGNETEFYQLYEKLSSLFMDEEISGLQKLELFHALSFVLLTFVNKFDLEKELGEQIDWGRLGRYDSEISWREWNDYFLRLAQSIIAWNMNDQEQSIHEVVRKVHEFIESHVSSDISLIHIADHVDLNPSYLSRLYKQITGNGLSEYLIEFRDRKAKDLLKNSNKKVHEIAAELGYNSSHSFIRFFKKKNLVTPQEYREQWMHH